ncbi:hypothetical protein K504DRAFT_498492 [Pleomassaria siparia CBS 279.74]|uniref:Uncharacterized protein n=1 Tax=Pleomassaria siparia CBS 279.74 TaxID=1314801 RepID=A0A6G1KLL0_9PLEO|nr:hypothetical protein K504DRAFT_498492 [Pleomassaria siparia CBS 279.74]
MSPQPKPRPFLPPSTTVPSSSSPSSSYSSSSSSPPRSAKGTHNSSQHLSPIITTQQNNNTSSLPPPPYHDQETLLLLISPPRGTSSHNLAPNRLTTYLDSIIRQCRYKYNNNNNNNNKVNQGTNIQHRSDDVGEDGELGIKNEDKKKRRTRWKEYEENPVVDRWLAILFCVLLLSVLFNLFLLFNGPPGRRLPHGRAQGEGLKY